jgi:hypothetical protein
MSRALSVSSLNPPVTGGRPALFQKSADLSDDFFVVPYPDVPAGGEPFEPGAGDLLGGVARAVEGPE